MKRAFSGFGWYFAISLPIKLDLFMHGPITKFLAAITGLPIE